ncbi:argininosuccinate lyase [Catenuloplanes japonicus]|uniref:argininosuccinate lyase n=1 Tax=Catenuloplanes japonicus TaxID=33876 RepID=UPI000A0FFC6C|nr:lyase family protein [Catenuloplanes japonicus]
MTSTEMAGPGLSGRISHGPAATVHRLVLQPQFDFEVNALLPFYVAVEKALLSEYGRLSILTADDCALIAGHLSDLNAASLTADPDGNYSDISLALERYIESRLPHPVPAWHVDRSRNDSQATAQLMSARARWCRLAGALLRCAQTVRDRAAHLTRDPMPGHTHLQAAQVMTPGFWLAALAEHLVHAARRWLTSYDAMDRCPLGAGAMTGQELDWDRHRLAAALGFAAPSRSALSAVASRRWAAELTAELALLGTELSRFITDLMAWGSSEYQFIDLPDALSGISASMPQKRNFPVLERLRGKTGHLAASHLDVAVVQRATPFSNMVEVSKESTANVHHALDTADAVIELFDLVAGNLVFRAEHMADRCRRDFLGGFSLANALTIEQGIPWRRAQVIAGAYITAAMADGLSPYPGDEELLHNISVRHGHHLKNGGELLSRSFDPNSVLSVKRSYGSTHPDSVALLLNELGDELQQLTEEWHARQVRATP